MRAAKRAARKGNSSHKPNAKWLHSYSAGAANGLVVPILDGVPDRFTVSDATESAVVAFTDAGILKLDTPCKSIEDALTASISSLFGPALKHVDEDYDTISIYIYSDRYSIYAYDTCLYDVLNIQPLIRAMPDAECMAWLGRILEDHDGITCPSRWPVIISELRTDLSDVSEDIEDADRERGKASSEQEINDAIALVTKQYPLLVNPVTPRIKIEDAVERIRTADAELADIFLRLHKSANLECPRCGGYDTESPLICVTPDDGDVLRAYDRIQGLINEGYYEDSDIFLDSSEESLSEFVSYIKLLNRKMDPIEELKRWILKQELNESRNRE